MKKDNVLKKLIKILVGIVLFFVAIFSALILFLTIFEYRPQETTFLEISSTLEDENYPKVGKTFSILSWNIGYGALGDNADFFMDGGKSVNTSDKERVELNVQKISEVVNKHNPDICLMQEMDRNSTRSYKTDEYREILNNLSGNFDSSFAYNYKTFFVPYPIPPIGKVNAGLGTFSKFTIGQAVRTSLPCPFKWPSRVVNLKRCLMTDRMKVVDENGQDTGKELVVINLHLEAYDSGEGKIAQANLLKNYLKEEYQKGNYVIAGGDFNQSFSNINISKFPVMEGIWVSGVFDINEFEKNWQFVMDKDAPSCRSLDRPYKGADTSVDKFQYYVIDGFIVSPNIKVEYMKVQDYSFENSDHNPVILKAVLLK